MNLLVRKNMKWRAVLEEHVSIIEQYATEKRNSLLNARRESSSGSVSYNPIYYHLLEKLLQSQFKGGGRSHTK